ncbi:phospholipase D-like domain-containing protein [Sphingomonas zeicaulis]|uniref:phospholipase D-like domain-containing protein n=1 Tax=Sphingomonas zeicaulis TaxID=1632740 RepID=UPI003D24C838
MAVADTSEPGGEPWFTVDGNRLRLLDNGPLRLAALLRLIAGARESLRILYYIYEDDDAGRQVRDALFEARNRNVQVSLIVDGFGSDAASDADFFDPLQEAGVLVCRFIPRFGRRYLLRNHQKLALADGERVIVGGFNISSDYFGTPEQQAWRDLGLWLEGPAAGRLAGYFDALADWSRRPKPRLRDLGAALEGWSEPSGQVRWLLGGPMRRLSPWARAVKRDMKRARRLDMIAAYFAPNPAMLRRLDRIGKRGQARVVTAAKSDNTATVAASRFTYAGLLRKGVRIYEYQRTKLHTKLFVIENVVYLGSANFDMRSLYINLELMLRIDDKVFADRMRAYVDQEIASSAPVDPGWMKANGGPLNHVKWAIAYFLVAVLDYNVTRRLNFRVSGKPGDEG